MNLQRLTYKYIARLCMLFTCALFFYAGTAQKVSVAADRNKILLGEQIVLQLKAEDINAKTSFLQNWFAFNDPAAHIQIVKKEPVDTMAINGLTVYLQKVTVTSFDSGRWAITPLPITLQDRFTGKKTVLQPDSLFIDVLPVDVSALQDYHDLKDIIAVEAEPDYSLYIIIAVSVIIIAVIIWLAKKIFAKKKTVPLKPVHKSTALDEALQHIKELQQQNLPAKGEVTLFYTKLNNITRHYFTQQLGYSTAHITSDELMINLVVYLQNEKRRTAFFQLLRLTDAVKFAKYIPGSVQDNEAVETTVATLQHIDNLIRQTKNNV